MRPLWLSSDFFEPSSEPVSSCLSLSAEFDTFCPRAPPGVSVKFPSAKTPTFGSESSHSGMRLGGTLLFQRSLRLAAAPPPLFCGQNEVLRCAPLPLFSALPPLVGRFLFWPARFQPEESDSLVPESHVPAFPESTPISDATGLRQSSS